jgi:TonB-linked SusC/RagA family outer membrane protein
VGYATKQITVGDQTNFTITLAIDVISMEELVVVGYGTVRKSDLTGSVSSVQGENLIKIPTSSPMQALQGKVAGLQVSSTSGSPGASPVVRIRGTGTFNNSAPIYVVDGMILDNIDFLSSSDIKSIEVLKDASSTAIYGSRGANGVIMVTTKSGAGKAGDVTINLSSEFSMQYIPNTIDLLDGVEFATIVNEISPGTYNNVNAVSNTDWQDLILAPAPMNNYQLSLSGETDKMIYYFGVAYFGQKGLIEKSSYQRIIIKLNNTYKVAENVRFGNNITASPYNQSNTNGNVVFTAYRAWPVLEPYKADGSYTEIPGVGNPLADLEYQNSQEKGIRAVGNFYGEVDFLDGFKFKSSFGVDLMDKKNVSFTPVFFVSPQQQNSVNDLNKEYHDRATWLWENTLSYFKKIDKHQIDALAGYTMQEATSEVLKLKSENVIRETPNMWYLNPSTLNPNNTENGVDLGNNFSMISYLFRVNYSFDNKYLFTATVS